MFPFLNCCAAVSVKRLGKFLVGLIPGGDTLLEVAEFGAEVWDRWTKQKPDEAARREELQALAHVSLERVEAAVQAAVQAEAAGQPAAVKRKLTTYLTQVQVAVRRTVLPQDDPEGRTVPADLRVNSAEELLPFLPPDLPRFEPNELKSRKGANRPPVPGVSARSPVDFNAEGSGGRTPPRRGIPGWVWLAGGAAAVVVGVVVALAMRGGPKPTPPPVAAKGPGDADKARDAEIGGDLARFQLGSQRAREGKFYDSVVLLREIKPDYSNYTLSQYQLALSAIKVQEENEVKKKAKDPKDPPRQLPDDKREFRDIAIDALQKIPDPTGAEAETLLYYLRAKVRLGLLLYSLKKYDDMVALAAKVQPALEKLKGGAADMERKNFLMQLNAIKLSAVYGKAFDANAAGKHEEVIKFLDPVVNDFKSGMYPEAREDQKMLSGLMGMALRANLQLERGARAKEIFEIWNAIEKERIQAKAKVDGDKLEAGIAELQKKADKTDEDKKLIEQQKAQLVTLRSQLTEAGLAEAIEQHRAAVLQQTFAVLHKQIEELRKKGDKEMLNRFSSLLPADKSGDKNLKPDVRFLLAQCYSSIGRYDRAIELLDVYPPPAAPAPNEDPARHQQDLARYKVAKVVLIHCYRLKAKENKDPESFTLATKELEDTILPTEEDKKKKQPGWGKRDINALKEEIQILMDREAVLGKDQSAWGAAVNRCNELLKILGPKLRQGGVMRDHYFEVGSFFVQAMTMYAMEPKNAAKREMSLTSAANFYIKVSTNFPDLGGEESKARYLSFINSPQGAELKKMIDQLMPK